MKTGRLKQTARRTPGEVRAMRVRRVMVIARCLRCGVKREIAAGEIPDGEHPMCATCSLPLMPIGAVQR